MINRKHLIRLQRCVCAVGLTSIPIKEYVKDVNQPAFMAVGTGFLISKDVAMTNRHVVEELVKAQKSKNIPDEQRMLMFINPLPDSKMAVAFTRVTDLQINTEENIDIGLIDFIRRKDEEFRGVLPPKISRGTQYQISEEVAVIGYPYGHQMLQEKNRIYRWGPVVQQGFLSAISPFNNTTNPNQLLLDARIAPGMSGSPIFRSKNGEVVGIIHSGWEATTALGFPLTQSIINTFLQKHDNMPPA